MHFPSLAADINDVIAAGLDWGLAILASMASVRIVIGLIVQKLVFQVGRSPKESLIR